MSTFFLPQALRLDVPPEHLKVCPLRRHISARGIKS